jgi:hypothetical protein
MEGRQRRSFTDDNKWQAVDLVASSGRSPAHPGSDRHARQRTIDLIVVVLFGFSRRMTSSGQSLSTRLPISRASA